MQFSQNTAILIQRIGSGYICYARVSTDDQNLDLQRDALTRSGCVTIYEETASGKSATRIELAGGTLRRPRPWPGGWAKAQAQR